MPPIAAFTRILCAVDFSRGSVEAFRVAVEMARLHAAAALVSCHRSAARQPSRGAERDPTKGERRHGRTCRIGLACTTEVASGRAFDEIVRRAHGWKADLIVLGAKGMTSLEEIIVGGTAERVTKEASCSVLVVRGG
jgi:nucleotide-binding universal stress UspA family protein